MGVCSLLSIRSLRRNPRTLVDGAGAVFTSVKPSIAGAAIRIGERIFAGKTQFEAVGKLVRTPNVSAEDKIQMLLSGEAGYVTDDGQFVNTDEAHEISRQAGVVSTVSDSMRV